MSNIHSQLFTELTSEEASVIEGGAYLVLHSATALKTGADFPYWNGDDLYIVANGKKIFGTVNDVDKGETVNINKTIAFSQSAKVTLVDDDLNVFGNKDDFLGSFTVGTTPTNGKRTVVVGGSGSAYRVTYSVV